jgi:DNA replication initiation complex subunit (GINS family)
MTDMTAEELKKWLSVWRDASDLPPDSLIEEEKQAYTQLVALIEQSVTTNQQVEQQKDSEKDDWISRNRQLKCYDCGKPVSTPVPKDTVVRAVVECPECIQKKPDSEAKLPKVSEVTEGKEEG